MTVELTTKTLLVLMPQNQNQRVTSAVISTRLLVRLGTRQNQPMCILMAQYSYNIVGGIRHMILVVSCFARGSGLVYVFSWWSWLHF